MLRFFVGGKNGGDDQRQQWRNPAARGGTTRSWSVIHDVSSAAYTASFKASWNVKLTGILQYETALQIFDGNLTVRETEKLVKKLLEEPKPSKKEDVEINKQLQIIYEQYEEKLKNKLGTKVKINQKNNGKGKIEIEYYSADDFDRIIEAITQK